MRCCCDRAARCARATLLSVTLPARFTASGDGLALASVPRGQRVQVGVSVTSARLTLSDPPAKVSPLPVCPATLLAVRPVPSTTTSHHLAPPPRPATPTERPDRTPRSAAPTGLWDGDRKGAACSTALHAQADHRFRRLPGSGSRPLDLLVARPTSAPFPVPRSPGSRLYFLSSPLAQR